MSKKKKHKKSGSKKVSTTEIILLATAILELIEIILDSEEVEKWA